MITDKEIQQAWREYKILIITWNLVSITGFLGFVVIANFILKNYLGYKGKLATCNSTKDGDFGADWWLKREGLKPSLWSAFLWWIRNHSESFLNAEVPEWNAGKVDEFRVIKCTMDKIDMMDKDVFNPFTKASKEDAIFGINHYAYRLNGKVFVSYSSATERKEKQFGAGGNEWRFWIKPIF